MKKLSAKIRLTLYTAVLMALMASALIALMFSLSNNIVSTNSMNQLKEVVHDNADELEFDDGELEVDDIDFFKKSVHTIILNKYGEVIAGNFPEILVEELPLKDNELTEIVTDDALYYVYDVLTTVKGYRSELYIRGVIAVDEVADATNGILQVALLLLPIFIILGAVGCYFIAKRTFRPIDKIVKTAEEISKSEDLSLRIDLKGGSPEINQLAVTFDNMFERLESAFIAEKQFTSDVSHELRTPTAVILAQCEYALGEKISQEDKEEALETVQRQAAKMSRLISDLLNLNRLERGVEKVQFNNISLSELVRDVCEEQEIVKPSDISFKYDIALNVSGNFDEGLITRLLTNLISNAFRYNKDNGSVEVALNDTGDEIVLSVKDNGIGISKEDQTKIWNRFYQVDSSRTAGQSGSMGLGLAMVKQVVLLHGGKVELESELGVGSLFVVKFKK